MKILAVSCSPQVGGSSDRIIEEVIRGAQNTNSGIEVDKFKLSSMKINGCTGCYGCKEEFGCIQRDDMQLLYNKLLTSDLLVFASPIYMGYITGSGKNFIERMFALWKGHFETHLPSGKKAVLILTRGHERESNYTRVADDLVNIFNGFGINTLGSIIDSGLESSIITDKVVLQVAYDSGIEVLA